MSDFWSRKLAAKQAEAQPAQRRSAIHPAYYQQAPQQVPQHAPQTSVARPWWDPTPPPQSAPEQQQQPHPDQQAIEAEIAKHLQKAQSSKQTETCPSCGSGNYMTPPPPAQSRRYCLECGYPVVQSGSGLSGMPSAHSGPATPARQIHDGTSNYQPMNPFARIGPQ